MSACLPCAFILRMHCVVGVPPDLDPHGTAQGLHVIVHVVLQLALTVTPVSVNPFSYFLVHDRVFLQGSFPANACY